jgi:outer membrane protein assembly factor BamE (lipoprotein component of BamABCDE complex)
MDKIYVYNKEGITMNTIARFTKNMLFLSMLVTPMLYTGESSAWSLFGTEGKSGAVVSDAQKANIEKGKTTRVQILQELGDPSQKIDLGKGKMQYSYVMSTRSSDYLTPIKHPFGTSASDVIKFTEFWIIFKNDIVEDFGEKATNKTPNFMR